MRKKRRTKKKNSYLKGKRNMAEQIGPIKITEGKLRKGGQNPPNISSQRPPAPGGSGVSEDNVNQKMLDALQAVEECCAESFVDAGCTPDDHTTVPICPLCGCSHECSADCPRRLVREAIADVTKPKRMVLPDNWRPHTKAVSGIYGSIIADPNPNQGFPETAGYGGYLICETVEMPLQPLICAIPEMIEWLEKMYFAMYDEFCETHGTELEGLQKLREFLESLGFPPDR